MDSSSQPAESVGGGRRWWYPTPDKFLVVMLLVGCVLSLSSHVLSSIVDLPADLILFIVGAVTVLAVGVWFAWLGTCARPQFGIRSLLLLVTLVALGCGLISFVSDPARRTRRSAGTDAELRQMQGRERIQFLRLGDLQGGASQVTDAGLSQLDGLVKLRELVVYNSPITDAGLAHLKGLASLKYLELYNTEVTEAGVQDLQRALPDCSIHHGSVP